VTYKGVLGGERKRERERDHCRVRAGLIIPSPKRRKYTSARPLSAEMLLLLSIRFPFAFFLRARASLFLIRLERMVLFSGRHAPRLNSLDHSPLFPLGGRNPEISSISPTSQRYERLRNSRNSAILSKHRFDQSSHPLRGTVLSRL